MSLKDVFKMPRAMKVTGRTSSITNAFVNSIIPCVYPTKEEVMLCLEILELDAEDLRCAYCGDKSTEWDHFRPIVTNKKPTGYISNIYNLVPSCGKCNQSKGSKNWKEWILSNARLSPKSRRIADLNQKVQLLERYEQWGSVKPVDFEKLIDKDLWEKHWNNCQSLHDAMKKSQELAELIKKGLSSK